MNDKEIDQLENDINEWLKRMDASKYGVAANFSNYVPVQKNSDITNKDVNSLLNSFGETMERLSMPKDKLTKLEEEENKGLFGITDEKRANILQGLSHKFTELLEQNDLTKLPNEEAIKIVTVFASFIIIEIVKHTKASIPAQINAMSAVCSNILQIFDMSIEECNPVVKKAMLKTLPIGVKALIVDKTIEKIGNVEDGKVRSRMFLEEVMKAIEEANKEENDNIRKFWKDDIYKK